MRTDSDSRWTPPQRPRPPVVPSSPAGMAHMPRNLAVDRPTRVVEGMPLRLACDRPGDRVDQRRILVRAGAKHAAEVGLVFLAEAHEELPGAGYPHPVAALAEVMRQRGDESDPPAGLPHPHVAR